MMQPRILLNQTQIALMIHRLCHQLIENYDDFSNTAIVGIQPRGVFMREQITTHLKRIYPKLQIETGDLDITFFRDDYAQKGNKIIPTETTIDFDVEGKNIIFVDDVLYTGRTIRSAMDALLQYGRPKQIELMVLIDRRFHRNVPIQPNYIGKRVDSVESEIVRVEWQSQEEGTENRVWILENDKK